MHTPDEGELIRLYRLMWEIRVFEERLSELYARGVIPGFVHVSIGQEATAVGSCAVLRADDYLVTHHRPHGHIIAKGAGMHRLMAELMGKVDGYNRGFGGHMHVTATEIGLLKTSGIVGAHLPLAVGAGLSIHLRGSDQVSVALMGDGALNQGTFHESLNLAAIWKLPVVFVVENNGYASSIPTSRSFAIEDLADRAAAYNIPGVIVDGNQVLDVREAMLAAADRARNGGGPTLIEAKTYRWRGHHEGDPSKGLSYRTREDVQAWIDQRDPIRLFERHLEAHGALGPDAARRIEADARAAVESAIDYATKSEMPEPDAALLNLYPPPGRLPNAQEAK